MCSKTSSDPEQRVAQHETCCQSVVADCCFNECNHVKRSQLLERQSDTHIGSITQWSEVRRAATHSWQRLTTRHMCTFAYSNAPLCCQSCAHMLACTHACFACFITSIHSTVMVDHSWKIAHSKVHE